MKEDQKETLKDVVNQSVVEDQMQSLFIYNEFFFFKFEIIIKIISPPERQCRIC